MKSLIITIMLLSPLVSYGQISIDHYSVSAIEEHPGIPGSPVVYTVTHYFIVNENNVKVDALSSDKLSGNPAMSLVFKKGDKFALQFKTYSHNTPVPDESDLSTVPYIFELSEEIRAIVFPGYNIDNIELDTYYAVYYFDGVKYEFELPIVAEDEIERIYYPSVKMRQDPPSEDHK